MAPLPKRGPGGRFLPRKSGAAGRNAAARTGKRKNSAELLILNSRKRRSRPSEGRGRKRNSAELLILGNPKKGYRKVNPEGLGQAAELYEKFHGETPREVLSVQESSAMRRVYTGLGWLSQLLVIGRAGTIELAFDADDEETRVLVATSPDGKQIYFIGGDQDLGRSLDKFTEDTSKDFIDLGECVHLGYVTQKYFDDFKTFDYHHDLGEESRVVPQLYYNKLQRRMILVGGEYRVELENLVEGMSPGIIN